MVGVVGPLGAGRLPAQLLDGAAQVADQAREPLPADLRPACRGAVVLVGRVAPLGAGVQVDVREEAEVQAGPAWQQLAGQVQRDPVRVGAQEARQADVAPGHQRERRQELLAELAVGDPRRAVLVRLERRANR